MSEQDKRAEEGRCEQCGSIYLAEPALCADCLAKDHAAALAQARREGVEAAVTDAMAFVMRCREEGETDLRSILYHLRGIAARLLAKGGTDG